jgi:hypothetical protein
MPQFYANPQPIYQPAMRLISSITNASSAVVTTTFNHNYLTGLIIRLDIPSYIGMQQANQAIVTITQILGLTSFMVNLNTLSFDPFAIPAPLPAIASTTALAVPVGEINSKLNQATNNTLPF